MSSIARLVTALTCLAFASCTTTLRSSKAPNANAGGIVYYLPTSGFELAVKFRITSCSKLPSNLFSLDYEVLNPEIKQRFIQDGSEVHVIEYPALNDTLKTTTANIALYPNGMLKSLNADIDDRTAQVVNSLGGAAVNLAKAVGVGGLVLFSPDATADCPPFIKAKLDRYVQMQEELRNAVVADKELEAAKGRLEKAKAVADQAHAAVTSAPKDASAEDLSKLKAALAQAQKTVERLTGELKGKEPQAALIQAKLQAVERQVSNTTRRFWVPTTNENCTNLSVPSQEIAKSMFDPGELSAEDQKSFRAFVTNVAPDPIRASICVSENITKTTAVTENHAEGLVYRMPVTGLLEIRKQTGEQPRASSPIFFSESPVSLPQFGVKGVLPLRNTLFDKNTLKVTFQEDGSLATLDFTAQSQAERGAAATQDLTRLYNEYLVTLRESKLKLEEDADEATKRDRQRRLEALDARINEINKMRDLEKTRSGVQDSLDLKKSVITKEREVVQELTKLADEQVKFETSKRNLELIRSGQ
jgi:hypothetical protein